MRTSLLTAAVAGVLLAAGQVISAPTAVPTFESLGLYWSPEGAQADRRASVRYKKSGTSGWLTGQDLVFDGRTAPSPPFSGAAEYRGSLVHLDAGTEYTVELKLEDGPTETFTASTWSENFPVGETVILPAESNETLLITESGSPGAYRLYTAAPGQTATIDVEGNADHNVDIRASHIIIRGLILKGAASHAIDIYKEGANTDIVIEDNDISGWGRIDPGGFGKGYEAAIRAENDLVERIVVQRNRIHHPRGDANSWCEQRDGTPDRDCDTHPDGPHGVHLTDTRGHHVIRYNKFETDDAHYFADVISGGDFGYGGFPANDTDIYGNYVERCWDNAIESEGGNRNVRIWGNYMDRCYSPVAIVPVSVGPMYIWRNIVDRSRYAPEAVSGNADERGRFIKAGAGEEWGGGATFIYHNTVLQSPAANPEDESLGVRTGVITSASGGQAYGLVTRNNIVQVVDDEGFAFKDDSNGGDETNDFDYDLYIGKILSDTPHQAHGIKAAPIYDSENPPLQYYLASDSPGFDAGVRLFNFNDGFHGEGPEMGAFESGRPPLEFGPDAYAEPPAEPPAPPLNVEVE